MAIQHIVLFKFKPTVSSDGQKDAFKKANELLAAIPVAKNASAGPPLVANKLTRGYNYAMTATFDDQAALNAYLKHPKHVELLGTLSPLSEGMVSYQFDSGAAKAKL